MLILRFIYNISFNVCNVIYTNNSSKALSQPQYYTLLSACGEEFLAAAACKAKLYSYARIASFDVVVPSSAPLYS